MNKDKELNIVKKVCAELGINQTQLSELLGVFPATISQWAKGDIPKMAQMALKLMIENKEKEEKLQAIKKALDIIKSI